MTRVGIGNWSENAWHLALTHLLTGSVDKNNQRFTDEVPSTVVVNMSGVSGGMSVSVVRTVHADPSAR